MKKIQLDCQNCLTHVQRKNLIAGSFTGRNFISYEALLVFHRTKSPSGRSFFNAVFETALTVSRFNFSGDPFWDDSVILEFFLNMRGTKWTFAEKFRISCQYGIRHDQRNNSNGEKIWKKNQYITFQKFTGRFSGVCSKFWTALSKLQSTCPMYLFNNLFRSSFWNLLNLEWRNVRCPTRSISAWLWKQQSMFPE